MPPLNIGFLGFGNQAAKQHARYLAENCSEKVKIVAIGDVLHTDLSLVHEHLKRLRLHDIPIYPIKAEPVFDPSDIHSVEELLENHPELDAMIISTPHAKHYYQVKACLERRLHVLVDKPLTLTYEHGKELVHLANNLQGPYLAVSSQRRYEDVYMYVKKVIDIGELGAVISIDSIISHSQNWLHGWQTDPRRAGGGILWSVGWHALDTIVYLVNRKAIAVDAALYYAQGMAVETHASALIFLEGGLSITLSVNFGAPSNAVYERLQIWGTQGTIILDRVKPTYDDRPAVVTHQRYDGRLIEPALTGAIAKKWAPTEAFIRLLGSLKDGNADCEKAKAAVVSTGADSLETVRVIEAIYTSAKNHKRVNLTD